MNAKHYFTIFLFAALAMLVHAADAPKPALTLAVYDFTGESDAAAYVNKVTALLTVNLARETNLVMLERAELTKALKEQAFGISGMVSSDAAAQIGHITGAKVLVAGQVMKIGDNHLILVANIVGTESGRLFAAKVEGAADHLMDLTSELSRKIAQTIADQEATLTTAPQETIAQRLHQTMRNLPGTNRPSVSVHITFTWNGTVRESDSTETELGAILLKAGFPVVDAKSERKPDIEITGTELCTQGPRQGDLYSFTEVADLKVQERRTGNILAVEHQVSCATDVAQWAATIAPEIIAMDALADKILPLLAKQHYEP